MAVITAFLDLHITSDQVSTAKATIDEVLVATRAFPGSLGVEVLVDIADDSHFVLVEKWQSLDDDKAYRAWRATPEGASALGAIVESRLLTQWVEA